MLDEHQLGDFIDRHFHSRLFRLETLDWYDVASDGGDLSRYLAGEPGPDMNRKGPWMAQIRSEVARGLQTDRVHVVRGPLSEYLRFEFEWGYTYNAAAGEHIGILDLAEQPEPADLISEDFWLIDDTHALQMHYEASGKFLAASHADSAELPRYRRARDAALAAAVPFSDYWRTHPQYRRDRHAA
jgi:hypothetical protein